MYTCRAHPYLTTSKVETVLNQENKEQGWNRSSTKNAKNGTEQDDHSSTQNETEQEGMEQERND